MKCNTLYKDTTFSDTCLYWQGVPHRSPTIPEFSGKRVMFYIQVKYFGTCS